jgi:hypothetical protein
MQIFVFHMFIKIINIKIKRHGRNSLEINKKKTLKKNNIKFMKSSS